MQRRNFLRASFTLAASALSPALRAASGRVLIIGGGWGGLAAARQLRQDAPGLSVTLIEKEPRFRCLPLSNRWLVGLDSGQPLIYDYRQLAQHQGYRVIQAEALEIDRERRSVATTAGQVEYDWLIISAGIRENFSAWFGDDQATSDFARRQFPSAFTGGTSLDELKKGLDAFTGGTLLMTIPPAPYRCPPAPYERAGLLAWWLKQRGLKARLVILDPNQPALGFDRVFRDSYRDWITYLPQARIRSLDPGKRQVVTEFDTIDFDHALLAPPQQAASLLWQSELIGRDQHGQPTGWAVHAPGHQHLAEDERVFLLGDQLDKVSPLFGYYPKTGQLAARQGQIAARRIAAQASGQTPLKELPESTCYVIQRVAPREISRIDTSFRFRGDGQIQQAIRQSYYAQAGEEDSAWAAGMFAELGLPPG